jgi:hypothetical protein
MIASVSLLCGLLRSTAPGVRQGSVPAKGCAGSASAFALSDPSWLPDLLNTKRRREEAASEIALKKHPSSLLLAL